MGDQPVLADLDPVGETALDHIPAERPLQEAEHQDARERQNQAPRQPAPHNEPDQRYGENHPDQPAQQSVRIFPEIDAP